MIKRICEKKIAFYEAILREYLENEEKYKENSGYSY